MSRAALALLSSLSLGVPWVSDANGQGAGRTALEVGQRYIYSVSFSHVRVGSAELALAGQDTLSGHPVWNATLRMSAGFGFFGVDDNMASWFDATSFSSRRFVQKLHEGRFRPVRAFRIDPELKVYSNKGEPDIPSVALPLDDLSFLYFVRTLKLDPGDVLSFDRYFQREGNPVTIRVVRRERIEVPAGEFNAIVIEPEFRTAGIFSRNGRARVWLSDDSSRAVLQLKSRLSFGSINLYLSRIVSAPRTTMTTPP